MNSYTNLKKLSDKNNVIEYRAEIPLETIKEHEKREIVRMGQTIAVPGFRKGKVPETMLREYIHPAEVLEEAADAAVRKAIRDLVEAESIDAIGLPDVQIKSIELNKPIEFTVRFAIDPNIDLPDYKKIGSEILTRKDDVSVTEKEIDDALLEVRRMAARAFTPAPNEGEKPKQPNDADLPQITDELAEKIAGVKTVAELRDQVRRELSFNNEIQSRDAKHDEIVKAIAQKAKLTVPHLLVEQELANFLESRNAEMERLGMTLEEYLKQIKKTEKELADEERAAIEERVRTGLVFQKIREVENITASDREIAQRVELLKRRYPHEAADTLRRSAAASIAQEKVFKLFEPEKPAAGKSDAAEDKK